MEDPKSSQNHKEEISFEGINHINFLASKIRGKMNFLISSTQRVVLPARGKVLGSRGGGALGGDIGLEIGD